MVVFNFQLLVILSSLIILATCDNDEEVEMDVEQEGYPIYNHTALDTFLQVGKGRYGHVKILYCKELSEPNTNTDGLSAYAFFRMDSNVCDGTCKYCQVTMDYLFQRGFPGKGFIFEFDSEAAKHASELYKQTLFSKWSGHILVFQGPAGPGGIGQETVLESQFNSGLQMDWGYMFHELADYGCAYDSTMLTNIKKQYDLTYSKVPSRNTGYIFLEAGCLSRTKPDIIEKLDDAWKRAHVIIYVQKNHRHSIQIKIDPDGLKRALSHFQKGNVASILYFLPRRLITRIESFLPNIDWSRKPYQRQGTLPPTHMQTYYRTRDSVMEVTAYSCETNPKFFSIDLKCRSPYYINNVLEPNLGEDIVLVRFLDKRGEPIADKPALDFKNMIGPIFYYLKLVKGPNYDLKMKLDKKEIAWVNDGNIIFIVGLGEKTGPRKAYNEEDGNQLAEIINSDHFKHLICGVHLRIDFFAAKKGVDYLEKLNKNKYFKYLFLHDGSGFNKDPIAELTKQQVENLKDNIKLMKQETYWIAEESVFNGSRVDVEVVLTNPTLPVVDTTSTPQQFTKHVDDNWLPGVEVDSGSHLETFLIVATVLQTVFMQLLVF